MKKVVTYRALFARINRNLAKDLEVLHKCPVDGPDYATLGDYYIVNTTSNRITSSNHSLEQLGRDLEVLQDHEELEPRYHRQ